MTVLLTLDEGRLRQILQKHLQDRCVVLAASNRHHARELLARGGVDVVIAGIGSGNELEIAREWRGSDIPVVLIGETPVVPGALSSRDEAPCVLLANPVPLQDITRAVTDVVMEHRQARKNRQAHVTDDPSGIVGESQVMRSVMALIQRAASGDSPVLLLGESGTGKEVLARALHRRSLRSRGPFVAVSCSAIPETLLENELFGHRQGAFTDARKDQPGLFQAASRGTIFLDEIGDMAPALQGKLLRVLEETEVHPLGASTPVPVDVRVVTATHRDLDALVAAGRFRHDLLYRINVIDIHVPPLHERLEDLGPLIENFLEKHGARLGRPRVTVSPQTMDLLRRYRWPGNVRELENVIERALVLGSGPSIEPRDLPDVLKTPAPRSGPGGAGRPLADVEREYILNTLRAVAGNKSAAARMLGVDRKTLHRKLGRLAIA
ncbi:MAG: sigma-54-dependent Fis family transcriptional regulator [Acidobacteria bacterium]|nr:sigma-54-dependent Fis family transcriptional regulator [Acidobacteriota bacterium]